MAGVDKTNFNSIKNDLTAAAAKSLGVPETSIRMVMPELNTVSELEGGAVIVTTISTKDESEKTRLMNFIPSSSFTNAMTEEVSRSLALKTAGIKLVSVTKPTVTRSMITIKDYI